MLSATLKRKRPESPKPTGPNGKDKEEVLPINGDIEDSQSEEELDEGEDSEEDEPFPEFDPASDSEDTEETEAESDHESDKSFEVKLFPKGEVVISNITGQPKREYPEIDPVYDSDSSTEEVYLPAYGNCC